MGKRRAVKPAGSPGPGAGQQGSIKSGAGKKKFHRREQKKIDSKPKDLDAQEIPYKLREIMKARMEMNKPKKKKKKPAKEQGPGPEELQTDIKIPSFKQEKNESKRFYENRVNQEAQYVMFLSNNQPDRMPEMDLDKKGKLVKEAAPKEKSQKKKNSDRRRLDKVLKKKEEKKVTRLEKEFLTDHVMFGEVVMRPPTLTAKPRKSPANTKPGEKKLLLKSLFDPSSSTAPPPVMSLARKRLLEDERERVVQAYRDIKKRKLLQREGAKRSKPHKT